MTQPIRLVATLCAAFAIGYPLRRLRMPGGMMIGAMIGVCALNLFSGAAYVPDAVKTIAQILAGALIGVGISREEARSMKSVLKPAAILIPCLLLINVLCGFALRATGTMDLITALMGSTPGGMSNIPLIAADLGADQAKVVVLQFVRLIMGIGMFPAIIRLMEGGSPSDGCKPVSGRASGRAQPLAVLATLVVAAVSGFLGGLSPVPSGTMAFATLGTIAFKMLYPAARMPRLVGTLAQCLSGAFVGASIGWAELKELSHMAWPVLLMVICYSLGTWGISLLLWRAGYFKKKEAMLAATPAGAGDMALISADMGVQNVNLIILQLLRLIMAITVFPGILHLIDQLFG